VATYADMHMDTDDMLEPTDELFDEMAKEALMESGLTEEEAERAIEDEYRGGFNWSKELD